MTERARRALSDAKIGILLVIAYVMIIAVVAGIGLVGRIIYGG